MKEKLEILNFTYALVEHCNLNCAMCDHFSPLARPEIADYDEFCRDFERLSQIVDSRCRRIGLMGGEPLLCPNIEQYISKVRACFPETQISIVTNGILLNRMEDKFFKSCKENSIEIEYTCYPIDFDYEGVKKAIRSKGVTINAYNGTDEFVKTSYFIPIKIDGDEDIEWNFNHCFHANNCIQLKHGKLYTCTIIPNIEHFNRAFATDIPVSNDDYIDIYTEGITEKDIMADLARPKRFCRFCDVKNRRNDIPWKCSSKSLCEWSVDEKI